MTTEELDQIAESVRAENAKYDHEINVCMGTGCLSQHSDLLKDALVKEVEAQGKNVFVRRTGCMGLCAAGPLVLVDPEETLYQHVNASNAEAVLANLGGEPVAALQCDLRDHFDQQVHVVLENSGHIDPEKIDDYIARDGYQALMTALTDMTPNGVIHQVTESGLRGRGGGGYPTGLKWGTVAKAARRSEVRDLQRRRGRSGRVHGSQRVWRAIRSA
jgi:bidirectional [NiFe] hydrogenase diaphorase subunit